MDEDTQIALLSMGIVAAWILYVILECLYRHKCE